MGDSGLKSTSWTARHDYSSRCEKEYNVQIKDKEKRESTSKEKTEKEKNMDVERKGKEGKGRREESIGFFLHFLILILKKMGILQMGIFKKFSKRLAYRKWAYFLELQKKGHNCKWAYFQICLFKVIQVI